MAHHGDVPLIGQSAPSPAQAQAQNNCRGDASAAGYCTPLTFTDATAGFASPPTTRDCQDACAGVNGDAGDWLVDFSADQKPTTNSSSSSSSSSASGGSDGRHDMLLYRCGFAVAPGAGTPADARLTLANRDILALYDGSLARFGAAHGGRVAARGTMLCAGGLEIEWFIQDLAD
ncbi:putative glycoside hydrolase family 18 protein [Rosellinia necatrix]|uniref:Putative glycoside hydrolase family 18 protein n=1 Tax=Rosellinia necatrix TaxID=77044 RepID=A0A1W2TIJ3_ROSNE|nr:putative glycoside hydrolase family 18 protein [Rosellinia necatrix]